MISRLTTLGNCVMRSVGQGNADNSKDNNRAAVVGGVALVVFSAGAYYGVGSIYRSLNPKIVAQDENSKWGLPPEVKKTLDKLFEGSSYSIETLPFYPTTSDPKGVERNKMNAPIMRGTMNGKRFIAIKVEGELTDEYIEKKFAAMANLTLPMKDRKIEEVLLIYQYRNDGPLDEGGDGKFMWHGSAGHSVCQPYFFTWNFTYPNDGYGPTSSQTTNFELVKTLIQKGVGQDIREFVWNISKK